MTNGYIYKRTMDFVGEIKETEEFQDYHAQLANIKKYPELYTRANEFRHKNYMIQSTENGEALIERLEDLEREFMDIRTNPLVDDFLTAEICFCRMMQEINELILEEIDFQ